MEDPSGGAGATKVAGRPMGRMRPPGKNERFFFTERQLALFERHALLWPQEDCVVSVRKEGVGEWWVWIVAGLPVLGWDDAGRHEIPWTRMRWTDRDIETPDVIAWIERDLRRAGAVESPEWVQDVIEATPWLSPWL